MRLTSHQQNPPSTPAFTAQAKNPRASETPLPKPIAAAEVGQQFADNPAFAFDLLADLTNRRIDCVDFAAYGYTGEQGQSEIPDLLERLAKAIRLVERMNSQPE